MRACRAAVDAQNVVAPMQNRYDDASRLLENATLTLCVHVFWMQIFQDAQEILDNYVPCRASNPEDFAAVEHHQHRPSPSASLATQVRVEDRFARSRCYALFSGLCSITPSLSSCRPSGHSRLQAVRHDLDAGQNKSLASAST